MRNSVLLFTVSVLMLITACNEDLPLKSTAFAYDKFKIQNDIDWVEIKSFDTVNACFAWGIFHGGLLLKDKDTLERLISRSNEFIKNIGFEHKNYDSCLIKSKIHDFNFESKDLILYFMELKGSAQWHRKIYRNDKQKMYLYLLEIQRLNKSLEHNNRINYLDEIGINKLPHNYKIKFDTIQKYVDSFN